MNDIARKTYRKVITSDELMQEVNPKNSKLSARFLKEKNIKSSEGTIKAYKSDLDIFFIWNLKENDNKFFVDIKKIEFSDFFSYCVEELQWSPNRFARMRACLSSFSNFIETYFDEEYPMFRNVMLKTIEPMAKQAVREKTILLEDQINDLLSYLAVAKNNPQEACLLALASFSGSRISELTRITVDIIDENNTAFEGMFLETVKQIKTKGRGKHGKPLHKYIIRDAFVPYLQAWLPVRDQIMKENEQEHNCLFIKRDGTPAKTETIRGWSEKWEKRLGVPFYFHSLRHYFVTQLTRLKLDSEFIVEISGWSSTDMYKIYNDLTAKDREWKNLDNLKAFTDPSLKIEDSKKESN